MSKLLHQSARENSSEWKGISKKGVLLAKSTPQKACACIINWVSEQVKIYSQNWK